MRKNDILLNCFEYLSSPGMISNIWLNEREKWAQRVEQLNFFPRHESELARVYAQSFV